MKYKKRLRTKIFWLVVWLLVINVWLYYQNYFDWQNRLSNIFSFIQTLDRRIISNRSLAMSQARAIVNEAVGSGNVSSGPCLKEEVIPEWSLDLVHNPRVPEDDLPENQCAFFLSHKTKHLLEYDLDGSLIGTK